MIAARKEENEVIIAAAGGIECIIAAAMHSVTSKDNDNENVELQLEACVALYNLAHQDDLKIKIAAAGGVECMLASMRRHTTRADVQVKYLGTKKDGMMFSIYLIHDPILLSTVNILSNSYQK